MSKIQSYLDFIKYCLHEDAQEPETVKGMDWDGLLDFSKKQAIAGVAYHGLLKMGNSPYKPDRAKIIQWFSTYRQIEECNKQVYSDASELTRKFHDEFGLECCILKGQTNALMYPDPYMRTPGDIDLWTKPEKADTKFRFWSVDPHYANVINIARKFDPNSEIGYHHIQTDLVRTPVEIHFFPSFMGNMFYEYRLRKYFEKHKAAQFSQLTELPGGLGHICVLTDDFNRIFQMSHLMHHFFFEGIGFRQMIDYYYLSRRGFTEEERMETVKVLKHTNLYKFTCAVMYVMKDVFGLEDKYLLTKPNERIGKILLSEILKSGNFGFYDNRYNFAGLPVYRQYLLEIYRNLHFAFDFPSETIWGRPISRWWHMIYKAKMRKAVRTYGCEP